MRHNDIFRIYSMTKPVVSVALLMLYEEGKFQLDDPLEQYLPGFRDLQVFADVPLGTLGLWSTAMDYARFAQMLLNKGELDGVRILGERTVELMTRNHLPEAIGTLAEYNGTPGIGYGLGVSVVLDDAAAGNLAMPGAFGWTGAATTRFIVDPDQDLVAIFMAQQWPYDTRLLSEFETLVYQAIVD